MSSSDGFIIYAKIQMRVAAFCLLRAATYYADEVIATQGTMPYALLPVLQLSVR